MRNPPYCCNRQTMRFLGTRKSSVRRPRTAPGDRIYAIGDIHGRYDLLRDLLALIEKHESGRRAAEQLHVVLLGDVIDRGPDSASILRFLHEWSKNTEGQFMLLGNHEEVMLRVHGGEHRMLAPWLRFGGRETLESFGFTPPDPEEVGVSRIMEDIVEVLPSALMDFVRAWPLTARSGDYYFCHAGIRPGIDLDKQAKSDLIWIREEFLESPADHGVTIVHGHSITPAVDLQRNRIGIDTGAYRTGVLTALFLEGGDRAVLSTQGVSALSAYADA